MTRSARASLVAALLVAAVAAQTESAPASRRAADVAAEAIERGVVYLLGAQNPDGSWGGPRNKTMTDAFATGETHEAWTVGTTGLVIEALIAEGRVGSLPAARRAAARLAATASRLRRCSHWDLDNVWGYVYGLQGLSAMLKAGDALVGPEREAALGAARVYLRGLAEYQSPNGGFGYYADPETAWRPEWATSFTTAAAVVAMDEARRAGLVVPATLFEPAVKALDRCRLPDFAYTYDVMALPRRGGIESINAPQGSLGRTQACGYARFVAGRDVPEVERRAGLDRFFAQHEFLDCALRKPIPHESWFANAAYFYLFGHYYASRMIGTLPVEARDAYYEKLVPEVAKTQEPDGGMWDFYISSHTKPYGTSFGIGALLPLRPRRP